MCYHKNKTTGEITNPRVYNPLAGSATDIPEHLLIYPGDKANGSAEGCKAALQHCDFLSELPWMSSGRNVEINRQLFHELTQ